MSLPTTDSSISDTVSLEPYQKVELFDLHTRDPLGHPAGKLVEVAKTKFKVSVTLTTIEHILKHGGYFSKVVEKTRTRTVAGKDFSSDIDSELASWVREVCAK